MEGLALFATDRSGSAESGNWVARLAQIYGKWMKPKV
jgi:hypothetical protein